MRENSKVKSKGFTLIELAVVLAIIAVLAAVLTPMVTGYLDQARATRAQADVRTIADAVKLYRRDTGQWPVFTATNASLTLCCGSNGTAIVVIGSSNGNYPTATGTGWSSPLSSSNTALSIETYLNGNNTGVSTTNAFPKARFAGPYIGFLDSDAWGNKYILTAQNLTGTTNHAYVVSAGPDAVIQTNLNQGATGTFTVGGDDIVSLIQ